MPTSELHQSGPTPIQIQNLHDLTTIKNQVKELNKNLRPSKVRLLGRLSVLSLATYGAYSAWKDYQNSQYKPQVDEKLKLVQELYQFMTSSEDPTEQPESQE